MNSLQSIYPAKNLGSIWAFSFFLIFASLVGFFVSLQVYFFALFVGGASLSVIAYLYLRFRGINSTNYIALATIGCLFILPLLAKSLGLRLFGVWQIWVMVFGIVGLPKFYRYMKNYYLMRMSIFLFALYMALVMLSSVYSGRFNLFAFLYQAVSNLKPILLLSFLIFASETPFIKQIFWLVIDHCWKLLIFFIAFEWLFPGVYFSIFGAIAGASSDPNGVFPSRSVGPFEHPSVLASISASFLILCSARAICSADDRPRSLFLSLVYLICLICAVQRQELAGAILSVLLILFLAKNIKWNAFHFFAIACTLSLIPALFIFFGDDIYREAGLWGVGTVSEVSHPRAQQYAAAFTIAKENFPFGSGLGTFGGAGAEKFDLSLYYEMGFGRYWWFGKQDYLLDTYWPNSIAEGGWIGFVVLLLHFLTLGLHGIVESRKSIDGQASAYLMFSGVGVIYLVASAFTSPSFQDPRLYFWIALGFALAYSPKEKA